MRRILLALLILAVGFHATEAAPWKPQEVRLQNGQSGVLRLPARLQIVTEPWNRIVAVPYLVYMPEKDRLLMLVGCDLPHHAMVLSSDDHGTTWTEPRLVHTSAEGNSLGLATSLTYLGQGELLLHADNARWFSHDFGATWNDSVPVERTPDGAPWATWDPLFVQRDAQGQVQRLVETGYALVREPGHGPGYQRAYLRSSEDKGHTWTAGAPVPQWNGVSEVAILEAANGDWLGACRTDISASLQGETLDHYEGLGISISTDQGRSWSEVTPLYAWGRHHPSLLLLPNHDLLMTYVVRRGYVDTPDGFLQFGIEAVLSHDHGRSWDLDHRYVLHSWASQRRGAECWWPSSQATSSVLLPDGSILTAFGTGFRSVSGPQNQPRDVGLIHWRVSDQPLDGTRTIRDAPADSERRNVFDPATMAPKH